MAKWLIRLLVWTIDRYYFGPPMSAFKTAFIAKAVDGGWELEQELIYYSDYLNRDVRVPARFFTDLASVPKPMQAIVPVGTGKNRRAAAVHDYLCYPINQQAYRITQAQADRVFREALHVCGVNPIGTWGMWLPVRCYQAVKGIFK